MTPRAVYRGAPGSTRKTEIHYTCPSGAIVAAQVYRSVNVASHPELRQRILSQDPEKTLNTARCPDTATPFPIHVSVVYHDPDHQLFVLVLPEQSRHRELHERAELLLAVAADAAAVPAYVRDFSVVFGAAGLRAQLDEHAARARREAEEADARRRERDAMESARQANQSRSAELDRLAAELARKESELSQREHAFDQQKRDQEREIEERAHALQIAEKAMRERLARQRDTGTGGADVAGNEDMTLVVPMPGKRAATEDVHTSPFSLFDSEDLEEPEDDTDDGLSARITEVSQVTELDASEAVELVEGEVVVSDQPTSHVSRRDRVAEQAVHDWIDAGLPAVMFVDQSGMARACVTATGAKADMLCGPHLDLRVQLHRLPSYPVVVLSMGTSAALAGKAGSVAPVALVFDVADDSDRQVLNGLARDFTFLLEIYDATYARQAQRRVTADLVANVIYLLDAADAHLASIPARQCSFAKARSSWENPDYDRYGWKHPEWSELREDKLTDLRTAQCVRRALAIADRFSNPKREEFLFMRRGYPLKRWNKQRRAVLARAMELGIWVGARLAPVAVEEGLARSHDDLVARTKANFANLSPDDPVNDLDPDAASDNWTALEAEAANAGRDERPAQSIAVKRRVPRMTPISSGGKSQVSGTIAGITRAAMSSRAPRNLTSDELLAQLSRDKTRVEAAIELCRRGEQRAISPVMNILSQLNRVDAVRVLSAMPSFGDPATQTLVEGLSHHKSFVRQGCALALAVLKNETAVEALSDQVIAEPTEIWREISRGLGTVGPGAIMPLASRLATADESAHERVAWTLAHIAVAGGKKQVQQLAGGRDSIAAAVARRALELMSVAQRDDLQVRGRHTPREQTVNRAFSRKFFQALEASAPMVDTTATVDSPEMSNPAMVLDEADLLEATEYDEDAAELLDESDLIPT